MSTVVNAPIKLRGRLFLPEELDQIKNLVESGAIKSRNALSKKICEVLDWRQDNGRLKDRSCRDVLQKLQDRGFLRLPPRRLEPTPRRPIALTHRSTPRLCFPLQPSDISWDSFSILTASGDRPKEQLWNEYVERYHYLGYGVPVGPHIKYLVEAAGEPVACLVFSGAAWKVAPRDCWIGWSHEQRENRLRLIVNNTRYLILPWIRVKNIASRILGLAVRRLPADWERLYAYRPLLVETFVHTDRHAGTCYHAANWLCLGETQGRGKLDRYKQRALPKKTIFVLPLRKDARARLRAQ